MRKVSFVATACCALLIFSTTQLQAQLDNVVVEIPIDGVVVPDTATDLVVQIFHEGNSAAVPNGDLLFIGGNGMGSTGPGFLASAACGLVSPADPTTLGNFPNVNYLIIVKDAAGTTPLSQNTDMTTVEDGTGLSCVTGDPDGDPNTDDRESADNAYYRSFNLAAQGVTGDYTVGSVCIGIDAAIEGNNPMGGPLLSEPVIDGFIPVQVNLFWTTALASITVNPNGPDQTPDASFEILIPVSGTKTCTNAVGDVNGDGIISLLDVDPFVAAVQSGTFICEADANEDGSVDLLDVDPFVALILGG